MKIDGKTQIVAVLGDPIAHTASPAMHNAAFDALGLNWRYVALHVKPTNLKTALLGLASAGFVGVNLTVPHKLLAVRYLDQADESAKKMSAANTLQFLKNGKIRGFSTDGYGLLMALKETFKFQPRGKTIAIIGCGGAGQCAAIQFAMAGARKLILINRTRSKAVALAKRIRSLKLKTKCVFAPESCDLVIQATSLGLKASDSLPVSVQMLKELNSKLFFDMIYRPAMTPAMKVAKKLGYKTVNGLGMLLHQGAKAFEIWTERKAPVEVMRRALYREIYGKKK